MAVLHIGIVVCVPFDKEGSLDALGGIGMNVDEPSDCGVDQSDAQGDVPECELIDSVFQDEVGHDGNQRDQEHMSGEPVVLHGRVRSDEVPAVCADLLARPSRVAERNASQILIGVGISSD